jgi:hypothetical protein
MSTDLKIKIARDLRSILELCENLGDEAIEHPNDREMPGGEALNLVGPAANLSEWEQKYEDAEARAIADKQAMPKYANDQESELHPRLLLGWWSEIVRAERGQPTGLKITVERAADYLRDSLTWMADTDSDGRPNFMPIDVLAADLAKCRSMLENVLKDGTRNDTGAAACFNDIGGVDVKICGGTLVRRTLQRRDCEHVDRAIAMAKGVSDPVTVLRQTLINFPEDELAHRSCDQGGRDDIYRCRDCEKYYTEAEYWLAVREHHEKEAG